MTNTEIYRHYNPKRTPLITTLRRNNTDNQPSSLLISLYLLDLELFKQKLYNMKMRT